MDAQPAIWDALTGTRRFGVIAATLGVVAAGVVVGLVAAVTVFGPRAPNVATGPSVPPSVSPSAAGSIGSNPSQLPDPAIELARVGWFATALRIRPPRRPPP